MKKLIYGIVLATLLSSCTKEYIQIFDTTATNATVSEGLWVYETDSIKVTYEFWASKGVMSFSVFNKLSKPIYVDWKNSAFIHNGNKLDYWADQQHTSMISYYQGYSYGGPLIAAGFAEYEGFQETSATTTSPERTTFIPPKAYYYRSQFYLMPLEYYAMNKETATKTLESRNDKPRKKTTVYEQLFDNISTPLNFRNFLSLSLTENGTDFFYVDNEFYLSSAKEMDYRHFRGKILVGSDNKSHYEKPSKKKTSFYNKIATENSVNHRMP